MTVVNLGEVVYRTIREKGIEAAERVLGKVREFTIEFIDVDRSLALRAARLKGFYKIAYADCMAAALAQALDAPLVTGDRDFEMIENLNIEWLPSA